MVLLFGEGGGRGSLWMSRHFNGDKMAGSGFHQSTLKHFQGSRLDQRVRSRHFTAFSANGNFFISPVSESQSRSVSSCSHEKKREPSVAARAKDWKPGHSELLVSVDD